MNHILISATHKSSGKTTVTLGLCAALARRGFRVQPFKKGPDYIDPMWLGLAAGRPCHNLDFHTMGRQEIVRVFARHAANADISVIEGNKGLHDGVDLDGSNSNAALATLLGAPAVLVIDAEGITRGVAPLLLGYQAFAPEVRIGGVILNRVGGPRHEAKLRAAIEHYTSVPVIGAIPEAPNLAITERHLGLIPSSETGTAEEIVAGIADIIAGQVDLDRLIAIAATSRDSVETEHTVPRTLRRPDLRIGIARDAVFGFYYPGDLDGLAAAGAELVEFDTLNSPHLPEVDGLFIGGGFPETHMEGLAANRSLRHEICAAIDAGMPTYAECGGLMYLSRRLTWDGRAEAMVGAIPADVVMHKRPIGRGYMRLRETEQGLWPGPRASDGFPAHEFHYSALLDIGEGVGYAYDVLRGTGVDGRHDGLIYKNVLASYAHLRDCESMPWTDRFVRFVRQQTLSGPQLAT